jgi:aspartate/methionine/tyrosine aminotransferase
VFPFSKRLPAEMGVNELTRLLEAKRRAGERILDLTESNPTRAGIEYPAAVIEALANSRVLQYEPEPFGLPAAREAVAAAYGLSVERLVLSASTSEAYSWLFKLLCNPGDEVLIPRPSYPLFEHLAGLESVHVRPYGLFFDHGWFIDLHTIERALNQRTRAIVLVNPNNPTGHFVHRRECGELLAVAARAGVAVISDEVFREYEIAAAPDSVRTLDGAGEGLVFTLNGLSKAAGLPQMKLGWMSASGDSRLVSDALGRLEIIADAYLSVGTPVQWALPRLLELRGVVQEQIHSRVCRNLRVLKRALPVEGGWTGVLTGMPEAEELLREKNVLVQPGYFYDFEKSGYAVVSLLSRPDVFVDGIEALGL